MPLREHTLSPHFAPIPSCVKIKGNLHNDRCAIDMFYESEYIFFLTEKNTIDALIKI